VPWPLFSHAARRKGHHERFFVFPEPREHPAQPHCCLGANRFVPARAFERASRHDQIGLSLETLNRGNEPGAR
jgi:hypothetical protein